MLSFRQPTETELCMCRACNRRGCQASTCSLRSGTSSLTKCTFQSRLSLTAQTRSRLESHASLKRLSGPSSPFRRRLMESMSGLFESRLRSLLFRSRIGLTLRLQPSSAWCPSPILLLFRQESAAEMMRVEMNSSALATLILLAITSMRINCPWWLRKTHKSSALFSTKEVSRLRSKRRTI